MALLTFWLGVLVALIFDSWIASSGRIPKTRLLRWLARTEWRENMPKSDIVQEERKP
jgi:hypothetical protein